MPATEASSVRKIAVAMAVNSSVSKVDTSAPMIAWLTMRIEVLPCGSPSDDLLTADDRGGAEADDGDEHDT